MAVSADSSSAGVEPLQQRLSTALDDALSTGELARAVSSDGADAEDSLEEVEDLLHQDCDEEHGMYSGPINRFGKPHGIGEFRYSHRANEVFAGDFSNGNMMDGFVYDEKGPLITMKGGKWTEYKDLGILSKHLKALPPELQEKELRGVLRPRGVLQTFGFVCEQFTWGNEKGCHSFFHNALAFISADVARSKKAFQARLEERHREKEIQKLIKKGKLNDADATQKTSGSDDMPAPQKPSNPKVEDAAAVIKPHSAETLRLLSDSEGAVAALRAEFEALSARICELEKLAMPRSNALEKLAAAG